MTAHFWNSPSMFTHRHIPRYSHFTCSRLKELCPILLNLYKCCPYAHNIRLGLSRNGVGKWNWIKKNVPSVSINNKPVLVQLMAWRRTRAKSFTEPMMDWLTDACMRHSASMSKHVSYPFYFTKPQIKIYQLVNARFFAEDLPPMSYESDISWKSLIDRLVQVSNGLRTFLH